MICGAALILAFVSAGASAQHRPAAWDTRLRSDPSSAPAPDATKPPEQPQAQPDGQKAKKKNAARLQAPK
jgi:hypothetical protein